MASGNITFNMSVKLTCNWCCNVDPFTCVIHGKENLETYKRNLLAERTNQWMAQAEQANQWMADAMKRVMQERIEVVSYGGRRTGVIGFDPGTKYTSISVYNKPPERRLDDYLMEELGREIDEYYWPSQTPGGNSVSRAILDAERNVQRKLAGSPTGRLTGLHYYPHRSQLGYHNINPRSGLVSAVDYTLPPYSRTLPGYSKRDVEATLHMRVHQAICTRECSCNNPFEITTDDGGNEMNRREVIAAEMRRLQKEMAVLDRFPATDPFENGTVLMFERVFGLSWEDVKDSDTATKYIYAALKVNNLWYTTGNSNRNSVCYSWSQLVEWLGDHVGEIVVMSESMSLEAFVEAKKDASKSVSTDGASFPNTGAEDETNMLSHGDKGE